MESENIRDLLLEKFDYPSTEIDITIEQIQSMSEKGRSILSTYCETGVLPDSSVNGLSLLEMRRQSPEKSPIALILIYDGLLQAIKKIA